MINKQVIKNNKIYDAILKSATLKLDSYEYSMLLDFLKNYKDISNKFPVYSDFTATLDELIKTIEDASKTYDYEENTNYFVNNKGDIECNSVEDPDIPF